MGKINPNLTGFFQGKVGKNVYYVVNDTNFVRTLSEKKREKFEEGQLKQQAKIALLGQLSGVLKETTRMGFPGVHNHSNEFVSANMERVTVEQEPESGRWIATVDYASLLVSRGRLMPVVVSASSEEGSIAFSVTGMSEEFGLSMDDLIFASFMDEMRLFSWRVSLGTRGEGGIKTVTVPSFCSLENLHAYVFTVSKNGKEVSTSVYLPLN